MAAEWSPELSSDVVLKDKRSIDELYITALAIKDGLLYAISKAHNIMIVIDPKQKSIIDVYGLPSILTNIRAMTFILVVGYDNAKHTVYCFKF
ncbi:hypothetical protein [Campylobacter iguaniorum]|uniref:hypothetical protein n=1 Tax=Campylobacter iguaniorum TaxID=1244531 RepID=UPI0007C917F8|nr:hypothetical protein [Campylobacter iguaniorum]